jgi:hypothetical protein
MQPAGRVRDYLLVVVWSLEPSAKNCWKLDRLSGSPGGVSSPGTVAASDELFRFA